jgi:undecaprenyl diphosphate synthase
VIGRLGTVVRLKRHADATADAADPVRPPVAPAAHPSGERPPAVPADRLPRHVAIIMDGNRRWAARHGLSRVDGYLTGERALTDVIRGAVEIGLKHLTVYAFSTENWQRPREECEEVLERHYHHFKGPRREEVQALGVRLRWAGRRDRFPRKVAHEIATTEHLTRHNNVLTLTACIDYGGRAEIAAAAASIARDAAAGALDPARVDESLFAHYLPDPSLPDVDLLIRPGGQLRTSNFLPWQATYAELVFVPTLWPDFDRRDLWRAILAYSTRTRTFGVETPGQERP